MTSSLHAGGVLQARLIQEVVGLRQHLQDTASQRDKLAVDLKRANASLHTLQREDRGHWEKAHLWGQYADARQRILTLMVSIQEITTS